MQNPKHVFLPSLLFSIHSQISHSAVDRKLNNTRKQRGRKNMSRETFQCASKDMLSSARREQKFNKETSKPLKSDKPYVIHALG